jgi:hypothetical protein
MLGRIKKIIQNKYIVATVVFAAFMFFGDKNNVFEQYNLHRQYKKVKAEHDYYISQIAKARHDYTELFTNKKNLERFAREKYLMKRDDEDVFVIVKGGKEDDLQKAVPDSSADDE